MLHFTSGDMFELPVNIRVNTVNCVGVMGAGVALAFKTRHPAMFRAYKKACDAGEVRPGTLHIWRALTEWILNFPTKRHWRENSKYEDIEDGLKALRTYLDSIGHPVRVALPALGCGHGGLDWPRVSKLIEHHLATTPAEVFVFEPADSRRADALTTRQKQHEDAPQLDLFGEES
jgi:O-acetyl-ADP-ribose deacetylase (regulator of RNase III)